MLIDLPTYVPVGCHKTPIFDAVFRLPSTPSRFSLPHDHPVHQYPTRLIGLYLARVDIHSCSYLLCFNSQRHFHAANYSCFIDPETQRLRKKKQENNFLPFLRLVWSYFLFIGEFLM